MLRTVFTVLLVVAWGARIWVDTSCPYSPRRNAYGRVVRFVIAEEASGNCKLVAAWIRHWWLVIVSVFWLAVTQFKPWVVMLLDDVGLEALADWVEGDGLDSDVDESEVPPLLYSSDEDDDGGAHQPAPARSPSSTLRRRRRGGAGAALSEDGTSAGGLSAACPSADLPEARPEEPPTPETPPGWLVFDPKMGLIPQELRDRWEQS